jgi:hypothetical protein
MFIDPQIETGNILPELVQKKQLLFTPFRFKDQYGEEVL